MRMYSVVYVQHNKIMRFRTHKVILALRVRAILTRIGLKPTLAEVAQ